MFNGVVRETRDARRERRGARREMRDAKREALDGRRETRDARRETRDARSPRGLRPLAMTGPTPSLRAKRSNLVLRPVRGEIATVRFAVLAMTAMGSGGERRKAKGGRRKAEGGRRKAEGERRKAKGERRKAKSEE